MFCSHGKISHETRVLVYVSVRVVCTCDLPIFPLVPYNHLSHLQCDYPGAVFRKPTSGSGGSWGGRRSTIV